MRAPEPVLLHIAQTLHHKPYAEPHDAEDICRLPETRLLRPLPDFRTVQDRDGEADRPDPSASHTRIVSALTQETQRRRH